MDPVDFAFLFTSMNLMLQVKRYGVEGNPVSEHIKKATWPLHNRSRLYFSLESYDISYISIFLSPILFCHVQKGWQFSSVVLIGVNFTAVLVIITLYTRMFFTIKNDRKLTRPALPDERKKREDIILAGRFFAIVLTDCLCWLPIVAIKLLAFVPNVTISCK